MTQTTTTPDVPLPAGAIDTGWEAGTNEYRVIRTTERHAGRNCVVFGSAVQFADGFIDDGKRDPKDPPTVRVVAADGMTVAQAREVAALILAIADELDGWDCAMSGDAQSTRWQQRANS